MKYRYEKKITRDTPDTDLAGYPANIKADTGT
jgi:hypothetical protein